MRSNTGYGVSGVGADERLDVLIAEAAVPHDAAVLDDRGRHARDARLLAERLEVALEERDGEAALRPSRGTDGGERQQRDKNGLYGTHGTLKSYIG